MKRLQEAKDCPLLHGNLFRGVVLFLSLRYMSLFFSFVLFCFPHIFFLFLIFPK
jgi:hypothetical protein